MDFACVIGPRLDGETDGEDILPVPLRLETVLRSDLRRRRNSRR